MVSRPLESARMLASETQVCPHLIRCSLEAELGDPRIDEPEIGNVNEGIVEGGKNTGDTEHNFTYPWRISIRTMNLKRRSGLFHRLRKGCIIVEISHLQLPGDREKYSQSQRARPSSWEAS